MRLFSSLMPAMSADARYGAPQPIGQVGWLARFVGGRTNAGVTVTEHTALQVPTVYACVNRIANPISHFPMKIMKPGKAGSAAVEVTDHPLSTRLALRPNPRMSSRTLRKTGMAHALLWGNGYVEIERNGGGQAVNLWPLLPWSTNPHVENDDLVYKTTIDGKGFTIPQDDVLHIMDLSQDGYRGLSPVALAREALGLAKATETFGSKFFGNDAKSGGFLLHPGKLSTTAKANLGVPSDQPDDANPAKTLERQGGLDNAHRVKVLEEGMKFVTTTIPPEDAQFLGTRGYQAGEIARMYDVPLIMLQLSEGTTSWGTGIEQLMIGFVRQTIQPWVVAWEQEMNWKLFTQAERDAGYYVKLNMKAYLRGDSQARAQFYKDMFGVAGISPNRICELEDEEGCGPDGDNRFIPSNFVPLARAITPPAPPPGAQVTETIRETR